MAALVLAALLGVAPAPCTGAEWAAPGADPVARRAAELEGLLAGLARAPLLDQLRAVNRHFNSFRYRSDRDLWGQEDHWATPEELLRAGAGDCEDLAIAKYFALRRLGIPAERLRITYVRDRRRRGSHMLLAYLGEPHGPLLLDTHREVPMPAGLRPGLIPVYGFNERQVVVGVPGGGERVFAHAGRWRLRAWERLLDRRGRGSAAAPDGILAF